MKNLTIICKSLVIEDANATKEEKNKYVKKLKETVRMSDKVDMKKKMEKMIILKKEDCRRMN